MSLLNKPPEEDEVPLSLRETIVLNELLAMGFSKPQFTPIRDIADTLDKAVHFILNVRYLSIVSAAYEHLQFVLT